MRRLLACLVVTLGLLFGACGGGDADSGDTQPRNNTEDVGDGETPGARPGGANPEGEGTGTGRGD